MPLVGGATGWGGDGGLDGGWAWGCARAGGGWWGNWAGWGGGWALSRWEGGGTSSTVSSAEGVSAPWGGAGDGVGSAVAVEVVDDAGAVAVCAWEADARGESEGSTGGDFDLDALHVELRTTGGVAGVGCVGLVEGDELRAEEVLAGGKVGDVDVVLALGGNELVDTPVGGASTVFPELDPDGAGAVAGGRSHVDHDWALVGLFRRLASSRWIIECQLARDLQRQ